MKNAAKTTSPIFFKLCLQINDLYSSLMYRARLGFLPLLDMAVTLFLHDAGSGEWKAHCQRGAPRHSQARQRRTALQSRLPVQRDWRGVTWPWTRAGGKYVLFSQ